MKSDEIKQLFERFEGAMVDCDGIECWSARDLMALLGYSNWQNFEKVMGKAKDACQTAGMVAADHFTDVSKMVVLGSGAEREIEDIALTRYACYLIGQNGDPRKPEIAFAQNYFAVQTRRAELVEQRLLDMERVEARKSLSETENRLSGVLYERGVDGKGFAIIRSKGDEALFRCSTPVMKFKLGAPDNRPLADFLPTLSIKAKDFASELTRTNVQVKDLHGHAPIETEHVANNGAVRQMMLDRGIRPENLPPAEDVKKVKRKLDGDDRKLISDQKKK